LNVRQVGLMHLNWDKAKSVAVVDTLAYIATGYSGVSVVNIANPASPVEIGFCEIPGDAKCIVNDGNYAYVANSWWGDMRVIDISNPFSPTEIGFCHLPGDAYSLVVAGDYVYLADGEHGLRVIDIANPHSPSEVGACILGGIADHVTVEGNYAYVSVRESQGPMRWGCLRVVDISNPALPVAAGYYSSESEMGEVAIRGSYAYTADRFDGFRILNIEDPAAPISVGLLGEPFWPLAVAISGHNAYVTTDGPEGGLWVIDISNPALPTTIDFHASPAASDVAVEGDYAYVAAGLTGGLRVYNITDPHHLIGTSILNLAGTANDVAVSGNYAYVADKSRGLIVFDVTDSSNPIEVSFYDTPGDAMAVALSGNFAYVADYREGLRIVDITDPLFPCNAGSYDTPQYAWDVAIQGHYAYVADDVTGLLVISITNNSLPTLAGSYNTQGNAIDVAVTGNIAYVADYDGGLRYIDISDPHDPTEVSHFYMGYRPITGVAAIDSFAYVVTEDYRMSVFNMINPFTPWQMGYVSIPTARDVALEGDHVYVSERNNGFRIIDITDPYNPISTGFYNTHGDAMDIAIQGNLAYVADGYYFGIYDCSEALRVDDRVPNALSQTVTLYPSYPNPFNPSATIRFELSVLSDVVLTVYNVAGQRVETLLEGQMLPGVHAVTFDGSKFSSGSYFYTLKAGEFLETKQMVLVK
ncbi:T9SS type A sorting domain-containing protein, partial [bacterium]|nr:T9SS type A sorting domain-containing protein [bacterium]